MEILIVGAGIGGLTAATTLRRAGHKVTLFEQSELNQETGAAIFLPPNINGLLRNLGFRPEQYGANTCLGWCLYSASGEKESDESFAPDEYPNPWEMIHRQQLHRGLKTLATDPLGPGPAAEVQVARRVVSVSPVNGTVEFEDGSSLKGDVIIGADGLFSITRSAILEGQQVDSTPFSTGKNCYRFLIERKALLENAATKTLFERLSTLMVWLAEDTRLVCYPCDENATVNFVAIHPAEKSDTNGHSWHERGRKDTLLSIYEEFPLEIKVALSLVDAETIRLYPLMDLEQLPTWTSGRLALLGDAAHPFLPHLGQGGAQAIEDAISLGVFLGKAVSSHDVPRMLSLYETARKQRAEKIQQDTRTSGLDLSLLQKAEFDSLASRNYCFLHDETRNSTSILESSVG